MRLLPFSNRTRPTNSFVEQFQKIAAHGISATNELAAGLLAEPEEALVRITAIEHSADDAVRELHRLVDKTFIPPYDKRDIVKLTHELDDVVDALRSAARLAVSYRALESNDSADRRATARAMCGLVLRAVTKLKEVVDEMPHFDHDGLREAAREISQIEDESDEFLAKGIHEIFPDPNQPLTAAMLAWRDIFRLLERTTDHCGHAIGVIISIARQEGA